MAIYIKGLLAPSCCAGCDPDFGIFIGCDKWKTEKFDFINERPPNCPLIEVKEPHGRLIDADKAIEDYAKYGISHPYDAYDLKDIMDDSPTVIEGSE